MNLPKWRRRSRTAHQTTFSFSSLPYDIRKIVYEEALFPDQCSHHQNALMISSSWCWPTNEARPALISMTPITPALQRTNRMCRDDCIDLLYSQTLWDFTCPPHGAVHFLEKMPKHLRRRLRSIGFHLNSMDARCPCDQPGLFLAFTRGRHPGTVSSLTALMRLKSITLSLGVRPASAVYQQLNSASKSSRGFIWLKRLLQPFIYIIQHNIMEQLMLDFTHVWGARVPGEAEELAEQCYRLFTISSHLHSNQQMVQARADIEHSQESGIRNVSLASDRRSALLAI